MTVIGSMGVFASVALLLGLTRTGRPGEPGASFWSRLQPGEIRLQGMVSDEGGRPVSSAKALVTVKSGRRGFGSSVFSTETDENGVFSLSGMAPGPATLIVFHEEYLVSETPLGELNQSSPPARVDVVLTAGLCISGMVMLPDGSPAADALVAIEPMVERNQFYSRSLRTGARGSFQGRGLRAGEYRVRASLGDAEALMENVVAGSAGLELVLSKRLFFTGRVVDEWSGDAVSRFQVCATRMYEIAPGREELEKRVEHFQDEGGEFVMTGLSPGEWTVWATSRGYGVSLEHVLEVPSPEVATLTLYIAPGVQVGGSVVDATGLGVARVPVAVQYPDHRDRVIGLTRSTVTDDQGGFEFSDLHPGRMLLYAIIESKHVGEVEVSAPPGSKVSRVVVRAVP